MYNQNRTKMSICQITLYCKSQPHQEMEPQKEIFILREYAHVKEEDQKWWTNEIKLQLLLTKKKRDSMNCNNKLQKNISSKHSTLIIHKNNTIKQKDN